MIVQDRAMRGEKPDGKMSEPLFPRLHVNDTDKGGPKPSPRNKMALYEQLYIPSQRLTDSPAAMLPLPPIYGGTSTLANTDSSNQGIGLEKPIFPPFQTSTSSYHSNVRHRSFSTDGLSNETNGNSIKSLMTTTHTRDLTDPENTFQPCDPIQLKWPSRSKNEAKFNARSVFHPVVNLESSYNQSSINKERYMGGSTASSLRLQPDQESEGNSKVFYETSLKSCELGQGNEKNICSLPKDTQGNSENLNRVVKANDTISPAILSLRPITREEHSERSNQALTSSNSQQKGSEVNETGTSKAWGLTDIRLNNVPVSDTTGKPKIVQCLNSVWNDFQHEAGNESSLIPDSVLNRNKDPTSNAAPLHSVSSAFISPDGVVEMIGHRHFWKVRREIINQQRVFSMQVFELHRIIKVQRIIAGSRRLLTEEMLFVRKTNTKPSAVKEPTHNLVPEVPSLLLNLPDIAPKIKVPSDNLFLKKPHTLVSDDFTAGITKTGQKFGKLPMWGLPPPVGNQWLVPVMSPSEGLIYKPYTEPPCPPPGGYLPTLYSTGGHNIPIAPSIGPGPTYFPPYGMPAMSPLTSGSPFEHVSAKMDSDDNNKDGDREMCLVYQSCSCIVTSERNVGESRVSKDVLPLFPTVPTGCLSVEATVSTKNNEEKTQVIQVIPRNPRLASESAARIIQLIQEERKHLCN